MMDSLFRNLCRCVHLMVIVCFVSTSARGGLFCHCCVEPVRPYCSPACECNWGVQQTRWRRFPESSYGSGDYCSACAVEGQLPQGWMGSPSDAIGLGQLPPGAVILSPEQASAFAPSADGSPTTNVPRFPQSQTATPLLSSPQSYPQSSGAYQKSLSQIPGQPIPQSSAELPLPGQPQPIVAPELPPPNGGSAVDPQPLNPPVPQSGTNLKPLNLPAIPGQASVSSVPGARVVGWQNGSASVQTVPFTSDQTQNPVYRGGFVYARRSGPVPGYQPPQKVILPPGTPTGASYPQTNAVDDATPSTPTGWKKFLKLPKLPRLKK